MAGGPGLPGWLPRRLVPPVQLAPPVYSEQAGIERHQGETRPGVIGVMYDELVHSHDADCDESDGNPLTTAESVGPSPEHVDRTLPAWHPAIMPDAR